MNIKEAIELTKIAIAEVEWDYPMDYAIAFETLIEEVEKKEEEKELNKLYYELNLNQTSELEVAIDLLIKKQLELLKEENNIVYKAKVVAYNEVKDEIERIRKNSK